MLDDIRRSFVENLVVSGALRFGDFTTKAGRKSPYFVNFGNIASGESLALMGNVFAQAIMKDFQSSIDGIFGPAYKGISLAVATAVALARDHQRDLPICYNRKEAKLHGEGGNIIGWTPFQGARVLVIDDVISRGTSIQESLKTLQSVGAQIAGILVGLDREEAGYNGKRASEEVAEQLRIPIRSVVRLKDVLEYLENRPIAGEIYLTSEYRKKIETYVLDTYR
jgi:orotate phosphoribosyltransferase